MTVTKRWRGLATARASSVFPVPRGPCSDFHAVADTNIGVGAGNRYGNSVIVLLGHTPSLRRLVFSFRL